MKLRLWLLLIFVCCGCSLSRLSAPTQDATAATEEPFYAPDFSLLALDGSTYTLSDLQGKWVVVNFWATWCVPCVEEMPALQQFVREQADDDNAPVVLLINQGESIEDITAFLASINVTDLPVLLDPDFDISDDYSVSGLPTTYIIDESGVMRYFKLGEMTVENMYTYLDALNPNGADGA